MRALSDNSGMKITAGTERVLLTLRENRVKHLEIYEEALEGYKVECLTTLKRESKRVKNAEPGKLTGLFVSLQAPVCNVDAYDTAIAMLEFHTEKTLQLTASQVQCFIRDQWDWSGEFVANTLSYTAGAGRGR